MSAPPAFQFYPRDFLADANVIAMTLEERGLYITLLACAWIEGSIPAEAPEIARLVHYPEKQFRRVWGRVSRCFKPREDDGRLINPRLESERVIQAEFRRERSEAGRIGGLTRASKAKTDASRASAELGNNASTAKAEQGESLDFASSKTQANPSSSSASASAIAETSVSAASASPPAAPQPRQIPFTDPVEERARAILAAVWKVVQPVVGRTITRTEWGRSNKRIARDLASLNPPLTDEVILAARDRATARIGEQVYSLTIIRDQLTREAAGSSPVRDTRIATRPMRTGFEFERPFTE